MLREATATANLYVGAELTVSDIVCVLVGAPIVVALIVTGYAPSGVVLAVTTFKVTTAGFPLVGLTRLEG